MEAQILLTKCRSYESTFQALHCKLILSCQWTTLFILENTKAIKFH